MSRRRILKMATVGAAALPLESLGLMSLANRPRQVLVPSEKGFTKEWLSSLTKRGKPTVYEGEALDHIGMPIGGIGSGQVYLSGDGRLWYWDIFNQLSESDMGEIRNGLHYEHPILLDSPFKIEFYTAVAGTPHTMDRGQWPKTSFVGKYPMGAVSYGEQSGVSVDLEAFSPFSPLDVETSSLPATIMRFTVTNRSQSLKKIEIGGSVENPCCLYSCNYRPIKLDTTWTSGGYAFEHSVSDASPSENPRPDIVFEDFEKATWEGWTVEGTAFGDGPVEIAKIPNYQGNVRGTGTRVANSHHTRSGEDVTAGDAHVGKLTSKPFTIPRKHITMLVGGGSHSGRTCVNLLVDGKPVRTATGKNRNAMSPVAWDVSTFEGQQAQIEIVDAETGAWGNIGVDQIVFTDAVSQIPIERENDFGTFSLGVVKGALRGRELGSWLDVKHMANSEVIGSKFELKPGESRTVDFVVSWHFPNVNRAGMSNLLRHETFTRHYATKFKSAMEVSEYVIRNFDRLSNVTKLWTETWYDSTLPYWFLDRTMANTSILSTSTCYRFDDGRFYGWEGAYCCPGTCTHVWQYAQAVGRLFPELEQDTRKRVDYGIAYHEDGHLGHRAEVWQDAATDGQCGTILRVYREHQMNSDSKWLKEIWPPVKRSIEYLIAQDPNHDGLLEGAQFNTLDATWYGKIAWISSLYVAALRAGEAMSHEMGDSAFAKLCAEIATQGSKHIAKELYNGEFFIQRPDPNFPKAINTNDGCHIDQVFGQSWALQVGLPRVLPQNETREALKSLFRYNFAPDVGKYREKSKIHGGRWYALAGEPGLLMCTWPRGGAEKAAGQGNEDWAVGYFNECMTGFEHQVAGHMIWEGLVKEGLAIEKTIHERYDAKKRNPYNEIECGDHYARAMASYGVYIAACGFAYHGPKRRIGFDPKINPKDFRGAFTSAEGWGTYWQKQRGDVMTCGIQMKMGSLELDSLSVRLPAGWAGAKVDVVSKSPAIRIDVGSLRADGNLTFAKTAQLNPSDSLELRLTKL